MSTQLAIDFSREIRAKDRGMATSAAAHHTDLRIARDIARELGADGRVISADDVRRVLAERFPDIVPGNWLGSVWERKVWKPVGFITSKTAGSHGNRLVSWVLR